MPEYANTKLRLFPTPPTQVEQTDHDYAELDVTTNFSFLRGASHPDELVFRATELGYRAIAITDVNSLAGVVRAFDAIKQVKEQGAIPPKLVIGARLSFSDFPDLLVYATDRPAYARLCRLLTLGKRRTEKGECALTLEDFLASNEGLLAALTTYPPFEITDQKSQIANLKDSLGRRLSLAASCLYGSDDQSSLSHCIELSRTLDIPLLATNHVHYHAPHRRMLQDVLSCVRHGCTIHSAGYKLFPNGERYLKSPSQLHRLFAVHPQAIDRALEIAEQCTFSLDELRYEYPDEVVPPGQSPIAHLADLTWRGAKERYPAGVPDKVRNHINHELKLIEQLKYEAYFLTVYDLVKFARSRGILCQGRGSAANSAVCYCIGVTSVDPNQIDVLFERFVSAARGEPPDIDVDFEHERREEVIQYVYEKYGRDRAGMTAEVISYRGRSAIRDVGKALGLSLDLVDQMAKKLDWWHRGSLDDSHLRELGLDPTDRTVKMIIALSTELLGFPRHLSQHVGGLVMTRTPLCELVPIENASMPNRTVIEWDKDDIDTLGILKVDVLALGMLTCISKAFQFLNEENSTTEITEDTEKELAGAAVANGDSDSISLHVAVNESTQTPEGGKGGGQGRVWEGRGETVGALSGSPRPSQLCTFKKGKPETPRPRYELHTIPPEDPEVYGMISNADTIGVFQIESRAQMSMLPRLRPKNFYDLVIEVAIVRPGPIQGNMVHPYLRRRNNEEPVTYPSLALKEVLSKTLGVPLFQEQAMKVAMVGAGFSAEEADRLRRAMAAWRKTGAIEAFHQKIVQGMLKNGYTPEFAEQCFTQIRGFGEYGFPESHAASFALLVYVSAWLKRYHPAAFCAALLNSQPMGFYAPAQIVRDAIDHGVEVRPPDVNFSEWDCTLEDEARRHEGTKARSDDVQWGQFGPAVRLGLRQIKGLRLAHAQHLVSTRQKSGPYHSIAHLHALTRLPRHTMERLAEADAFASLGLSRRQALWKVLALDDHQLPLFDDHPADCHPERSCTQRSEGSRITDNSRTADQSAVEFEIGNPKLKIENPHLPPMPLGQEVMTDYTTTGLSLKRHPVSLVREKLDELNIITSEQLRATDPGKWVRVAGLVLIRQRPGTASGIVFVTLEDETGIVNLIVRPNIYDKYRPAARHAALLHAEGYVERQGDVIHVMTWRMFDLSHLLAGYHFHSRDFH